MANFLFWNVGRTAPISLIGEACREHDVDILILAEFVTSPNALLAELNSRGEFRFFQQQQLRSSVTLFVRFPRSTIAAVFDDGRFTIQRIELPIGARLILAACHLPSKQYRDSTDQAYILRRLRQEIEAAELSANHKNTMIIGDLNLNPFEEGMKAIDGLHAVMDKHVATRDRRTVLGQTWDYFYNPMWSRLGDESAGPPGTYFHSATSTTDPYWHTLDQVLLRPSLLPYYHNENLKVLTKIGSTSLLGSIGPNKSISDHLPIWTKLEIERG